MITYEDQRVAVFIDTQNMYYSARNLFGQKVNFGNIVETAREGRQLVRATAYVVATKTGDESAFFEALKKTGIETKEKHLMEYLSGFKNADWEVGITVDVMSMLGRVDTIVLVSGDGDFTHLAQYVQNHGCRFEVMSFRETTSSQLVEVADRYTNLSDDKNRYLMGRSRRPPVRMTKGAGVFIEDDQLQAAEEAQGNGRGIDNAEKPSIKQRAQRRMGRPKKSM